MTKEQAKEKILNQIGRNFTWLNNATCCFWGFKGAKFKSFNAARKYTKALLDEMVEEKELRILNEAEAGQQAMYSK